MPKDWCMGENYSIIISMKDILHISICQLLSIEVPLDAVDDVEAGRIPNATGRHEYALVEDGVWI